MVGRLHNIEDTLVRAAKSGCEVKTLLLNPESSQAEQRGKDLGYVDAAVVKALIRNDLEVLRKCALRCGKEARNKIKVRPYDSTPVIPIHGYDDTNVVGIYWRQRHSQEGPQLEVHNPELDPDYHHSNLYLAEAVAEHFDDIWDCERTIELKWEGPENAVQKQQAVQIANPEEVIRADNLDRNGPHEWIVEPVFSDGPFSATGSVPLKAQNRYISFEPLSHVLGNRAAATLTSPC